MLCQLIAFKRLTLNESSLLFFNSFRRESNCLPWAEELKLQRKHKNRKPILNTSQN